MIKEYSLKKDGKIKLSENFSVKEWASKDGADKILINLDIVPFLEAIRTKLNCSKIVIHSGYRTSAQDKKVGGSGSGPHTEGNAVDIYCYNQNGEKISSKLVCCVACDMNMNGIAYIAPLSTHLDTKARKWWGDETITTKYGIEKINGSKDFYEYFRIPKPQTKYNLTKLLKKGSTGKEVKELQRELNKRGLKLTVDGIFGTKTFNALKTFQKANGLVADGKVGKNTAHKLGWLYQGK